MSDLISRSELIKHFEAIQQQENVVGLEFIAMIDEIKEQPTAYSVDKVVEELEEAKHEICLSDDDLEHYQNGIDNAIEIVKQGGVSDDACEWELKNACYTTSIKHYYSLPTSIVKTFNNCPYCGKKIKVVE